MYQNEDKFIQVKNGVGKMNLISMELPLADIWPCFNLNSQNVGIFLQKTTDTYTGKQKT